MADKELALIDDLRMAARKLKDSTNPEEYRAGARLETFMSLMVKARNRVQVPKDEEEEVVAA